MKKDKELNQDKVEKMPYRSKITDAEITSLFLGLCRIVKQQALEEARLLVTGETERNLNLCREIVKKNREIEMLRMINFQLKKKIDSFLVRQMRTSDSKSTINE